MIISLNAVLPMFLMIGCGFLAKRFRLLTKEVANQATRLYSCIFLPAMLCNNIYHSELNRSFNLAALLFCLGGLVLEFLVWLLLVRRIERRPAARGVMLQASFRCNIMLLGLPIVISLFGQAHVGSISVIAVAANTLINILAVISLEIFRGRALSPGRTLRDIAANPMLIASFAGAVLLLLRIPVPYIIESALGSMAKAATPVALVLLGATLELDWAGSRRNILICNLNRLIISPAFFLAAAVLIGFRGADLAVVLAVFAGPVAVSSLALASEMNGDCDLARAIILSTTMFSCLTLFLWIWMLNAFGLL